MMLFMTFVVIILLNMLIAMMAETYTIMADRSFANYCLGFGKLLVQRRQNYYTGSSPPLNLLSVPYEISSRLYDIGHAVLPKRFKVKKPMDLATGVAEKRSDEEQEAWEVPHRRPPPSLPLAHSNVTRSDAAADADASSRSRGHKTSSQAPLDVCSPFLHP